MTVNTTPQPLPLHRMVARTQTRSWWGHRLNHSQSSLTEVQPAR
jgi:hypothetical protein